MRHRSFAYGSSVLASVVCIALTGCGSDSTVSATLKVTSMAAHPTSRARAVTRGAVDANRLLKSSTHYSFAVVDGVKYHLTKLRAELAGSDDANDVTASGDSTFTDSSSQVTALNQAVDWPTGTFRGISVHLTPTWSVKAYCRTGYTGSATSGYLVYTRANDVVALNCSTGGVDCTQLPSDYDFKTYTFLSNYAGYATDYQQETHTNFTVAKGDSPIVSVLYDGSYNISCWDGTTWSDSEALSAMAGFSDDTTRQQYYPNSTPAFGSFYVPIFGYVTTNASEATPTARTFLTSPGGSNTDFPSTGYTLKGKPVVTLVYKADGTIFAGATRNYSGNASSSPFDLDLEGFATSSGGTGNDFYSSGWFWSGSGEPTFVRNRKFTAFNPPTTLGTVFQSDATDGPDCGLTKTDFQGNNASRACNGGTQTVWWKEVTR